MTGDTTPQDAVVIERNVDAPVAVVWQMWTDPEHFKNWYGPIGATIVVAKMDVRVGGTRLVGMEVDTPNGLMQMWFTGRYLDVVEHQRLVYTESMADENGNVPSSSHMRTADGHPGTTEVRVQLEDLGGRTRLVLTHTGIPSDSPGAAGWVMAFDKLDAILDAGAGR